MFIPLFVWVALWLASRPVSPRPTGCAYSAGGATKLYAARVRGDFLASFPSGHASCSEPVLTQPGRAESICHPDGKAARTGFAFMGHAPDGTSLLQCCPATGRTHQIRLHLAALGHPIANDLLYAGGDSAELAEAAGECQARWEAEQVERPPTCQLLTCQSNPTSAHSATLA